MSAPNCLPLSLRVLGALPLKVLYAITRAASLVYRVKRTKAEAITRVNLNLCYPALEPKSRNALVQQSLLHDALSLAECAPFYTWSPARLQRHIDTPDQQVLDSALQEGKGVILCAPHFGAWELLGQVLSQQHPLHVLYKPSKRESIDKVLIPGRTRFGARLHPTTAGGVRSLHRALADNALVSILPDQEPDRSGGEFAPFFGEPALTMTLLYRLARKRKVPVVLTAAVRDTQHHRFTIVYSRIDNTIHSDDTATALSTLNGAIESLARQHPEQYVWSYRRFQSRPDGSRRPYGWPAA